MDNQDRNEQLHSLMFDYMRDIVLDNVPEETLNKLDLNDMHITELDSDDDGEYVYGEYRINVDNGKLLIDVDASAIYKSFEDKWDSSTESHYTVDVFSDKLEDFEWDVKMITELSIDKAIDNEIEMQIDEAKRN